MCRVSGIHMIIGVIIGARDGGKVSFVSAEDLLVAGMRFYDDIPNEIFMSEMFTL